MAQAKTPVTEATKIQTQPRGNGVPEKGEKEKSEKALARVLGH